MKLTSTEEQHSQRLNLDGEKLQAGLARLVLTLMDVLHELLEKQMIRRVNAGDVPPQEAEQIGLTFIRLREMIGQIVQKFDLKPEDLNSDLRSLDSQLVQLENMILELRETLAGGDTSILNIDPELYGEIEAEAAKIMKSDFFKTLVRQLRAEREHTV